MRYSYEFKRKAIKLFHQGEWPETPTGVLPHTFHDQIRKWVHIIFKTTFNLRDGLYKTYEHFKANK